MIMKCILADDEPLARKGIEKFIKDVPFLELVDSCTNALQLIDKLGIGKVDLLFLDIQMPKMGGIEVLRRIAGKSCRVILLTAHADEIYRKKCLELNVLRFYDKITEFHDFIEFVKAM